MRYIKGLDALRGMAVTFVIITHWGPHTIRSSKVLTFFFTRIVPDGQFGVDLFFVLSGYLITRILLKARAEATGGKKLEIVKVFYIRRSLRIFPIYYLLLFVLYLLNYQDVRDHLPCFLTYTSNFLVFKEKEWSGVSHTWSLAVEEQFYLFWPWIIVFLPAKRLVMVCLIIFSAGLVGSVLLEHFYGSFFFVLPLPCMTAFAVGALYASLRSDPVRIKKAERVFSMLLPVCLVLFFLYQFGSRFWFIRAVNAVIAINVISYVVKGKYNRFTAAVLNNGLLTGVGKISYGIYLYHYVVPGIYNRLINYIDQRIQFSDQLRRILINPPSAYLINLMLVLLISYISYYLFEIRVIKLKAKFAYVPSV